MKVLPFFAICGAVALVSVAVTSTPNSHSSVCEFQPVPPEFPGTNQVKHATTKGHASKPILEIPTPRGIALRQQPRGFVPSPFRAIILERKQNPDAATALIDSVVALVGRFKCGLSITLGVAPYCPYLMDILAAGFGRGPRSRRKDSCTGDHPDGRNE